MTIQFYILDESKNVIPATTLEWGKFWGDWSKRCQFDETIEGIRVCTIFMGHEDELFETTIFRPNKKYETFSYKTYEEAKKGHERAVAKVREETKR